MNTYLDNKITKYSSAEELLNQWFDIRLTHYQRRKLSWISVLEQQFEKYFNLVCFLKSVIDGELMINNRKKADIISDLEEMEFLKINNNFDYLLNIPVYHLSLEKYEEYRATAKKYKNDLKEYKLLTIEDIWLKDLEELETALDKLK